MLIFFTGILILGALGFKGTRNPQRLYTQCVQINAPARGWIWTLNHLYIVFNASQLSVSWWGRWFKYPCWFLSQLCSENSKKNLIVPGWRNTENKTACNMKCETLGMKSTFHLVNFPFEGFPSPRSMGECDSWVLIPMSGKGVVWNRKALDLRRTVKILPSCFPTVESVADFWSPVSASFPTNGDNSTHFIELF